MRFCYCGCCGVIGVIFIVSGIWMLVNRIGCVKLEVFVFVIDGRFKLKLWLCDVC